MAQQQHREALLPECVVKMTRKGRAVVILVASHQETKEEARVFSFISSANGLMNQANSSITDGMSGSRRSRRTRMRRVIAHLGRTDQLKNASSRKASSRRMKTPQKIETAAQP